jgi:hypothetical protein
MDNDVLIEALTEENTRLKTRLALHFMDATEEDKKSAEQLFYEQRDEITILNIELAAVKQSRDEFQHENRKLKRRLLTLEKQLKG